MRVKELFAFIRARHDIFMKRTAGHPKPWTADPVLQQYKFCNVYRELDTVTVWIRKHWREPYDADPNLWFAMTVARLVNWPDSLRDITPSVFTNLGRRRIDWYPSIFVKQMDARKRRGEKLFTGAYMIRCDCQNGGGKAAYLAKEVLTPMWEKRTNVTMVLPGAGTLSALHSVLTRFKDMGSFMAGQVVADTKFQTMWRNTNDWWTFAAPGPGSRRGLNRVYDRSVDANWPNDEWQIFLGDLQVKLDPLVAKAGMPHISAQDLQNCLCEFDKYERVRLGEGRPRSLYPGV